MDAVIKPSPVPSSPTTKSPFRGMPDRSSGFKNRTPSKLGADGEAVNGGRNGFTAVEFRSEWEDELERRAQRRRESESLREEGESPLGRKNSPSPPIPPPRAPRNESESAPSSAGPVPPPRRQLSNEQQRQREAAAALEAAVQRAAEVGAADYAALEEAEGLGKSPTTKSPTPPPRLIRSAGSSGGSEKVIREKGTPSSSPRQEGDPDPSAARSFAGTTWVAKPGGPQRRPLHPLRPPAPREEEEVEPPPPDPQATCTREAPAACLPSPRLRGLFGVAPAPAAASGAGAAASHSGRSAPPSSDAGRSHASAESRDTDGELLDLFLDPAPSPKRLVRFIHPLVAYAFVLRYGRRIPGPMPGSLPDQGQEPPV